MCTVTNAFLSVLLKRYRLRDKEAVTRWCFRILEIISIFMKVDYLEKNFILLKYINIVFEVDSTFWKLLIESNADEYFHKRISFLEDNRLGQPTC